MMERFNNNNIILLILCCCSIFLKINKNKPITIETITMLM